MSIVAQLSNDLTSLIAETRRRSPEIKHASERSLTVLKNYNAQGSQDESAFLREISQSSDFIAPFLLSCSSRNAKFSTIAILSLQRLIQVRAVPLSRLDMLLEALTEATRLAVDIQLKVLQILPTLFQTYADFIGDTLLAKLLHICAMLQQPSKVPMVVNTAGATQQQLVLALFDKVIEEDKLTAVEKEYMVCVDDDAKIQVSANAFDAFRVFSDICSLIEHQKPTFLTFNVLSESFGLELLENIFTNYHAVFLAHQELGFLVRTRITPLLLRFFSSHKDFSIVVRVCRIILLLIKSQLTILEIEAEVILSLLTHAITTDSNSALWKKALALEIFSAICLDFDLTRAIFQTYDATKDKKKIITEFFFVCSNLLSEPWAQSLLKINDIVSVPTIEESISAHNSSLRIPLVDILDKQEPPPIPKSYSLYLILGCTNSLCDGIGKFVLDMSRAEDHTFTFLTEEDLQTAEVTLIKTLISSNAKSIVTIGSEFLYSSLGNDLFHTLIRALQKVCHGSGVLGLSKERDSLLMLFSIATVSNVTKKPIPRNPSVTESLVDTMSGAFSAPPTLATPSKRSQFQSRDLNPRHVICFRALASLTTSLGPVLGHSWKFILITFQWFDYFVNGPSKYLSFKETPLKPNLTPQDLKSIDQSLSRFDESTRAYEGPAYRSLIEELIALSTTSIFDTNEACDAIDDDEFKVCYFNRDYYILRLQDLCKVNSERYLEKDNEDWSQVSTFLADVSTAEQVMEELRITAGSAFDEIIMEVATKGFTSSSKSTQKAFLERLLFRSISEMMDRMLETHSDEDFSTAESEIIHGLLKTLYELLNRFGTQFKDSWGSILHIIGSPFKILGMFKNSSPQKQLLKSAFEILQLTLNDFLHDIPVTSFKDLIDVLEQFCSQTYELNVSFSGVSYYWLISDHLRSLMVSESEKIKAGSDEELIETIDNTGSSYVRVHCLWLYLLRSIVHISNISRAEVKNGAVQTFFKIVESHGHHLDWDLAFNIVVQKLLNINLEKGSAEFDELKAFVDINTIILKGITEIYLRFYIKATSNIAYLEAFLGCYKRYISLDLTQLSVTAYESVNNILSQLETLTDDQFESFFFFWSTQPLKYVALDTDLYQMSLIEFVGIFQRLYNFKPLTGQKLELTLSIFNSLIRFPFLPKYSTDVNSASRLQQAVLDSLSMIDISSDGSLVLPHLASMVLLPFQTRSRIIKKLHGVNKKEIPSFVASSLGTLTLLRTKISTISDFKPLIVDGTIAKVMKSLTESIVATTDDDEHNVKLLSAGIWKRSSELLTDITKKVYKLLDAGEEGPEHEVWSLIIDAACITLPGNNFERDEVFNGDNYKLLRDVIIWSTTQSSLTVSLLDKFVAAIWKSSSLYANNDLEKHLFQTSETPDQVTKGLMDFAVEDYTTAPIEALSQNTFREICLNDLFAFSHPETEAKLLEVLLPYLHCRVVMIIKKFAGSQRLLNRAPVATIQQRELTLLLNRLYELLQEIEEAGSEMYKPLLSIFPLILDNHRYMGKQRQTESLLTSITAEFYKISSK